MYNPCNIPGFSTGGSTPNLWTNPNDADKRILNVGDISELKNKSIGTLANPSQANAARQPAFQASGINGKGCLETVNTDADDVLISDNPFGLGKDFVVQYVFKFIAHSVIPSSYPYQIAFAGSAAAQFIPFISSVDSKLASRIFQGVTKDLISSINPLAVNGEYIATHIYDFTNNLHTFRLNGVEQGTSTTTMTGSVAGINITYFNLTAFRAMSGLMGEAAVQFSIPPIHEIKRRERYLANFYNISI